MTDSRRDLAALSAVATDYVEGMVLADETKLRRAFHPTACIIGHQEGATEWQDLQTFIADVTENAEPPVDASTEWRLLSLGIAGDTAVMVVEDEYLETRYTDTLSLLYENGRWQIVAKVYWAHAPGG